MVVATSPADRRARRGGRAARRGRRRARVCSSSASAPTAASASISRSSSSVIAGPPSPSATGSTRHGSASSPYRARPRGGRRSARASAPRRTPARGPRAAGADRAAIAVLARRRSSVSRAESSGVGALVELGGGAAQLAVPVRLLAAHTVDGSPVGDRDRPRRDAAARAVEAGRLAPDLDEDLLGHLLGLRRITQRRAGRRRRRVGARRSYSAANATWSPGRDRGDDRREVGSKTSPMCQTGPCACAILRRRLTTSASSPPERRRDRGGHRDHAGGSERGRRTDASGRVTVGPRARRRGTRRPLAVVSPHRPLWQMVRTPAAAPCR